MDVIAKNSTYTLSQVLMGWLELFKLRITTMVLLSMLIGYHLALKGQTWPLDMVFWLLLGSFFMVTSASVANHAVEIEVDKKMSRTCNRPLPKQLISVWSSWCYIIIASIVGALILAIKVNVITMIVIVVGMAIYILLYTPLKKYHGFCIYVGAIPGASSTDWRLSCC